MARVLGWARRKVVWSRHGQPAIAENEADQGALKVRKEPVRLTSLPSLPVLALICAALFSGQDAYAGAQKYEPLAASVRAALHRAVADRPPEISSFYDSGEAAQWLNDMSRRLERSMPDPVGRMQFLKSVHYEATRAGLDPQMVLGLIQVESGFRKYAVSPAGARGFMQVMPFWQQLIGQQDTDLFHMRTNLRFGCTILRHYVDIEKGDLFRALGRYNGSLGRPEYPNLVRAAWEGRWSYPAQKLALR